MSDLDLGFVRRAEKVTSFNLTAKDFESLTYKKEIQHLFNKHFFPEFDLSKTVNTANKNSLNRLIKELKRIDPAAFHNVHAYNLKGIGPGEVTLYFLINKSHLGGGSSAGVDLVVGSNKYEVKAVKISRDRVASDFKLGGTVPLADIQQDLNDLRVELKLAGTRTEMSGSIIQSMREKAPQAYKKIEQKFKNISYDKYFKSHDIIFINNSKTATSYGEIEAVKAIQKKDIMIERVTSGTIKPKVDIK